MTTTTITTTPASQGGNTPQANLLDPVEIAAQGQVIGETMFAATQAEDKTGEARSRAKTMKEKAFMQAAPMFAAFGLGEAPPLSADATSAEKKARAKEYAKECSDNPSYVMLREQACEAMSTKIKDPIEHDKAGNPKFSQRVSKQWSRIIVSYRDGGDGGQTDADANAREAEKTRKVAYKAKAEALDRIIASLDAAGVGQATDIGDDTIALLDRAVTEWG